MIDPIADPAPAVRVLVVDDSAFARKVLREVLSASAGIQVLDTARDGLEALEKIETLHPDVVTLDLVMPNLDGLGVLRNLASRTPDGLPSVVVVSFSDAQSDLVIEALNSGAFDLVHKPTAMATARLYDLGDDLLQKIRAAAAARAAGRRAPVTPAPGFAPRSHAAPGTAAVDLVVIGTSTGGPQALTRLLTQLPADFPVPVVAAVHIPAGYTRSMAERLSRGARLQVIEAGQGPTPLVAGHAVIARGGAHLIVERNPAGDGLVAVVDDDRGGSTYVPSIDRLFASAATATAGRVLGVVLTGMGDDGLRGARAIRAAGGLVLTESESSCVVYGMPREVWNAGLAQAHAPLDELAGLLQTHVGRRS